MKIFVTGATGFTGSFLTEQLLEAGHDVVGLDNQRGYRFDELKSKGAELHVGSVTDKELVDQLTQGCDRVYHLAAAFRKVNLPRQVYWDVNVEGTRNVLEAAKKYNVPRVLYCSTCGVHGNVENPPADESSPIAPADWYQETKWEGEKVCHEFLKTGHVDHHRSSSRYLRSGRSRKVRHALQKSGQRKIPHGWRRRDTLSSLLHQASDRRDAAGHRKR